jgi:6-pyruvoyltetrahydropterin/6-carboxytetrahydropterin synthase
MSGFFEVYVESHFSAAHCLVGYPGDCARLHGHNWNVRVFVTCDRLDETGMGVDFRDLKRALGEVLADFDHTTLNDLPAFKDANPTSENIARFLYREIRGKIDRAGSRVSAVMVAETPEAGVFYRENECL